MTLPLHASASCRVAAICSVAQRCRRRRSRRSSARTVHPIRPRASPTNATLLQTIAARFEGRHRHSRPQARVLIQPAGRTWDYFHEVSLHWGGAIVILGTIAGLGAAYLIMGRLRISEGRSGRKCRASTPSSGSRIGSPRSPSSCSA